MRFVHAAHIIAQGLAKNDAFHVVLIRYYYESPWVSNCLGAASYLLCHRHTVNCVLGPELGSVHPLSHPVFTRALWLWKFHCYFSQDKTEAQRSKIIVLVSQMEDRPWLQLGLSMCCFKLRVVTGMLSRPSGFPALPQLIGSPTQLEAPLCAWAQKQGRLGAG